MKPLAFSRCDGSPAATDLPFTPRPRHSIQTETFDRKTKILFETKFQTPSIRETYRGRKKAQLGPRTLLIDNYDSYTYNLFQVLAHINGVSPKVVKNDEISWRTMAQQLSRHEFDNIVISPGPGSPQNISDVGICRRLLEEAEDIPLLGVCLGMQLLAQIHGGIVGPAPEPIHGRLSEVRHSRHPLFAGIPSGPGRGFDVVRYHSLAVDEATLPEFLEPVAWTCGHHHAVNLQDEMEAREGRSNGREGVTDDGKKVLMGLAHRQRPHWGVQFHPESVATKFGAELLRNFRDLSSYHNAINRKSFYGPGVQISQPQESVEKARGPGEGHPEKLEVRWRVMKGALEKLGGSPTIFWHLFGHGQASDTFWLDSSSSESQRFSYMGGKGGPLWRKLKFKLAAPAEQKGDQGVLQVPNSNMETSGLEKGELTIEDSRGHMQTLKTHFLDFLEEDLKGTACSAADGLPFDFCGGLVGYLGYELKAECGAKNLHASPYPDAAMFFADRLVAVDHEAKDVYLVALSRQEAASQRSAEAWLSSTSSSLQALGPRLSSSAQASAPTPHPGGPTRDLVPPAARKSREEYVKAVEDCLEALSQGESYELCLTTQIVQKARICPRDLYNHLRRSNPSAHAAWLSFGPEMPVICCSSPERFLRGSRDGVVEARPIKGTAARSEDPSTDAEIRKALLRCEKSRAENMMIVDLLRNDLGRFCQVGTVHVSKLMEVESYATVHNLVSTVRGVMKPDCSPVDCIRAAFPGGSMTGAPKLRSMQILDKLENCPRGVYSGSLGFIGINGTFDLNIVIRTALVSSDEVTIGAGGAVVLQSDPLKEYEEMKLKAHALLTAVQHAAQRETQH